MQSVEIGFYKVSSNGTDKVITDKNEEWTERSKTREKRNEQRRV